MKLYIPHAERRAHPRPAATRDGIWVALGLLGWAAALVVVLVLGAAPGQTGAAWLPVVLCGLGGGLVLLLAVLIHRLRR